ncbi:MAG: hypothetical protein LIP28_09650 [Deltaproteobacteria bacterium]|nr:hypothetical protein [Deltaproteobacteria bacterium]
MRSPAQMDIIQIEMTNQCIHSCGNCTRFCGHHATPFFMDYRTFKRAVGSMKGFRGTVGIMGGEPTLHPEFAKFVAYYRKYWGKELLPGTPWMRPGRHFNAHLLTMYGKTGNQRGLFTSLTRQYAEHFELIQDTFGNQLLNDHSAASMHQPLLVTRAELGIDDDTWVRLRDNCWVQNSWSASITPKGAFFCEVAAAMDMLLDGPGGWPIEPGWWERTPEEFGSQLQWCELCSAPLPMPRRDARTGVDDISPGWIKLLEKRASPKLKKGKVIPFDCSGYAQDRYTTVNRDRPYLDDDSKRISGKIQILMPKNIWAGFVVPEHMPFERAASCITSIADDFGLPVFVCAKDKAVRDWASQKGLMAHDPDAITLGTAIASCKTAGEVEWVCVLPGVVPFKDFFSQLETYIFNPGCLYMFPNGNGNDCALFFSTRALSLDPEWQWGDFVSLWPANKRCIV